jgi:hypothetical protein
MAPDSLERPQRGRLLDVVAAAHVGVSGLYLALPTAFDASATGSIGWIRTAVSQRRCISGGWLSDAHFGRFAGNGIKTLWVVSDSRQRSCSRLVSSSGGLASRRVIEAIASERTWTDHSRESL